MQFVDDLEKNFSVGLNFFRLRMFNLLFDIDDFGNDDMRSISCNYEM